MQDKQMALPSGVLVWRWPLALSASGRLPGGLFVLQPPGQAVSGLEQAPQSCSTGQLAVRAAHTSRARCRLLLLTCTLTLCAARSQHAHSGCVALPRE